MRTLLTALALTLALQAQGESAPRKLDFGEAYSFDERAPKTQVEQTIDKLLPSVVKVFGASGLATIKAYATGIVVSERGHILTLDQILLQKGRTRVVLYDGTVHDATLYAADEKLGVADNEWQNLYLAIPGLRIAGGTDEVLRNIISERVLGMPPETRKDKGIAFKDIPTGPSA